MIPEFAITQEDLSLKPLPVAMTRVTPAIEAAVMVKKMKSSLAGLERDIVKAKENEDRILGEMAVRVFLLERIVTGAQVKMNEKGLKNLYKEFRSIQNQAGKILKEAGITTLDPTGKSLEKEIEDNVEIIGWLPGPEEKVKEVSEPIVYRNGKVIRLGQVVMESPSVATE